MREKQRQSRLRQQEAAQGMLAPMPRETLFGDLAEGTRLVAAGVVDRHSERRETLRRLDEALRIVGACGIADDVGRLRSG
jgi:hypothetical protein